MEEQSIDDHLRQALLHLETALDSSVRIVSENEGAKKEMGLKWEGFLGEFLHLVRDKGRKSRINLLGWINFSKLR
jgi:hypothetical protein